MKNEVHAQAGVAVMKTRPQKEGMWKQTFKRVFHDKVAMIGFIGIVVLVLLAILAPVLTPYHPDQMDFASKEAPSLAHLMGTDELGRDYLTRLLYGARYSLTLGIASAFFAVFIGVVLGAIAGYYGSWVDNAFMRFCDIVQSIPGVVISIIISLALGTGYVVTIFALALGGCTHSMRLMRAQVMAVRSSEYLDAAKTINCGTGRIIFGHIMPNVISPLLLDFTMKIAQMIQFSAGLSVIGMGVQPPTPEWGAMVSAARDFIKTSPHMIIFPGLFIFAISLFINFFGDGLRDAMDPKLKK